MTLYGGGGFRDGKVVISLVFVKEMRVFFVEILDMCVGD